jgi:Holliday junction resolvase RusA-like endonuclease
VVLARAYTDAKTLAYEKQVKTAAKEVMGSEPPLITPLKVVLQFTLPIPASITKKRLKSILDGMEFHTKKPDIDNLIKATVDGMDKVVFDNDCQIVNISATKCYGNHPRVDVYVTEHLF